MLWDPDSRPHEVTLLRIKHITIKERYGEVYHHAIHFYNIILLFHFTNMSSEESEKPYKCNCGESFNTQDELDQHRKMKADNSGSNLK